MFPRHVLLALPLAMAGCSTTAEVVTRDGGSAERLIFPDGAADAPLRDAHADPDQAIDGAVDGQQPGLAAPALVVESTGDGEITLRWSAVEGAQSYALYRAQTPGVSVTDLAAAGATSPHTDRGLSNGVRYYFTVGAFGTTGEAGPLSNEVSAVPASPDPAPVITSISPGFALVAGGTRLTVQGESFQPGVQWTTVAVGQTVATDVVVRSSAALTAVVPALPAGSVSLTVSNPDGQSATTQLEIVDLVRFAMPGAPTSGSSAEQRDDWADTALFATTIQGIANREGANLFVDATTHDAIWWPRITAAGQALAGKTTGTIDDPLLLYEALFGHLAGLVVWDDAVAATVNVGTAVAGADDLALLRYDDRAGSLYRRVLDGPAAPTVVVDLVGKFDGTGQIPDTVLASSGSAKCDAYRWLIERYIKTGKLDHRYLGYMIDAYWRDHYLGDNATQLFNRDLIVAERGAVFDLSVWGDETPIDDPGQPLGTDRQTLLALLEAYHDRHGGQGFTQVVGFTPWAWKYTDHAGAGGSHAPVPTEWETARVLSAYNAGLDADALGMTSLANATVWRRATLPRRAPAAGATPRRLRDIGAWDNRLQNPGFDDNDSVGGWTPDLTDYLTIVDPAGAHHGAHYLSARATTDQPPNSISQDVAIGVAAGETVHASVWVRAISGAGTATLAVWGLGGTQESRTVSAQLVAGDPWQRLAVALPAQSAHSSVRWELYLPVGATTFGVDSAALWLAGRPSGVSGRHYIVWHMGDYDAGAWLYQMLPTRWDDLGRGTVPLAWAFNPNLIDRFGVGFAHVWSTATARDHFVAGDTVASYVNVTQLYGTRDPSGLPDGRQAFETFARPYLQRSGITTTIFALNGSAGPYDDAALTLLGQLTGRGVAYNMAGQSQRTPRMHGGVPVLGQDADLEAGNLEESADRIYAKTGGAPPDFHVFRSVLATPTFIADLTKKIVAEHPERRHTVVAPQELFALIQIRAGQQPAYRLAFIDDNLPASAPAGSTHALKVTLRNDGWDSWPSTFNLGVHVASSEIPPRSLTTDAQGYPYRFALPRAVAPGDTINVVGQLPLPAIAGAYTVQLDLVHEGVTWFESQNNLPWQARLEIR